MKINIDVDAILRSRGMGSDAKTQRFIANEVANLSDDYVPFQSGTLKNTRIIANDGSSIPYRGPYAKKPTGRQMAYDGGPMRGPRWTERMMANRRADLMKRIAVYVGGKAR